MDNSLAQDLQLLRSANQFILGIKTAVDHTMRKAGGDKIHREHISRVATG